MKIGLKKAKNLFFKSALVIAENIFWACLCLLTLSLVIGILLFYNYAIFDKSEEFQVNSRLELDEEEYKNVLDVWDNNSKKFKDADTKIYFNPFYNPSAPATPETLLINPATKIGN